MTSEEAYAIYYFLVASGVWLNVVSINMARGFRKPLGARAARAGGQGRALVRQLAAWSAYGWGAPALLTAVAVSMFLNRTLVEEKGFVAPTFIETRTCLSEDRLTFGGKGHRTWGAMYYYYIPMTLLVVANGACLAFTTYTIRKMKKETAMVQKIGSSTSASGTLQNARLYVKLLLTAGVTEIALEVTVWAVRPHDWDEATYLQTWASTLKLTFVFHMAATLVDVARALAVLWLSAGRWTWPGRAAQAARLALRAVRARAARAARAAQADAQRPAHAHARDAHADAASVDTSTTGC
ncbi:G-protein coupled receptor Mth2 [Gryllus bimaculatus]|nr:G-protein coupled receptor Mth2 [Gryllus bimaculatus]